MIISIRHILVGVVLIFASMPSAAQEIRSATPIYIKLEAEDFGGFEKYKPGKGWEPCMPWWPHWSRGGDSGWWAAQAAADVAAAEVSLDIVVPQTDSYVLWVRYEDYLGKPEPFDVLVSQVGGDVRSSLGKKDVVTRADAPFPWSFAWDKNVVQLKKGPAKVSLVITAKAPVRRGVDAVILTTDTKWQPRERGFPPLAYAGYLDEWARARIPLTPLVGQPTRTVPHLWTLPQIAGRDFWYLGASEFINGFPLPVLIRDDGNQVVKNFAAAWGAKPEAAPIWAAPVTALQFPIRDVKKLLQPGDPRRQYILQKKRPFVLVGNYASAGQVPNSYPEIKKVFGDLWLGIVSGEGTYLGLTTFPHDVPLGKDFKDRCYDWILREGKNRWQQALAKDWASPILDPFEKFILCSSVGTIRSVHQLAEAGCHVLGAESAAAMPYIQAQLAFSRGAARQYGRPFMWYFGASFGDAIRTFTKEDAYVLALEGLKVNNRSDTVGPSLAHIRRTMLHAYLQGASFMFPEQGYNFFTSDGKLNPMGWSYDEMVRLAVRHPDRGVPCTPVAVLLDKAHGWDKYDYTGMHIWSKQPLERADRMIDGFFNVAYFPFPRNEGDFANDLNVPWPNGYFGDVFDVLVTSPTKVDAVKAYPVVFCVGDTHLDAKWSQGLKEYVDQGGTLVINIDQVVAGMDEAFLGAKVTTTVKEGTLVECLPDGQKLAGTTFPYRLLTPVSARVIAKTESGDPVALVNKVGKGQVILTTPSYLVGQDGAPLPYLARLLLQVTSGLLPVQIQGNCQHSVNLHPGGYVVVLSHNEGLVKSSHGPAKINPKQTTEITLRMKETPLKTQDWLGEEPRDWSYPNEWLPEYTRPMKIHWEKKGDSYTATVRLLPGEIRVFFVQTR
jgi:hypothetical protein